MIGLLACCLLVDLLRGTSSLGPDVFDFSNLAPGMSRQISGGSSLVKIVVIRSNTVPSCMVLDSFVYSFVVLQKSRACRGGWCFGDFEVSPRLFAGVTEGFCSLALQKGPRYVDFNGFLVVKGIFSTYGVLD